MGLSKIGLPNNAFDVFVSSSGQVAPRFICMMTCKTLLDGLHCRPLSVAYNQPIYTWSFPPHRALPAFRSFKLQD